MTRKEEIKNELLEIAPYLAKLNLTHGFTVPKDYFQELPESVMEELSPLASLKKSKAFSIPENYFESLPDLVMDQIRAEEEAVAEVAPTPVPQAAPQPNWLDELINSIAVFFQPKYALRLAGIALVVAAGFFVFNNSGDNIVPGDDPIAGVDPLEVYGLSVDDLDDDDLAFLLEGDDTDADLEDLDELDEEALDQLLDELDDISGDDLEGLM